MAKPSSSKLLLFFFFFFIQLLILLVTSSDIRHPHAKNLVWEKEPLFSSIHRTLVEYFQTEFDSIDPPTTAVPSAPITNPVTTPVNTAPGIITVPGINPPTNPVNPPVPISNPVTTPSTNPPTASGGNNGRGQSWCVAKNGALPAALQSALDYACGIGGADCDTIQQGSSCYEPATLQNHASYAFNSYYQKNPVPTSCDFGGAAAVTTTNPSTGSCVYPSSSSSSLPSSSSSSSPPSTSSPAPPITQTPANPTYSPTAPATSLPTAPATSLPTGPATSLPTAGSTFPGAQSPPPGFSFGNPDPTGLGAFGASPPLVNIASVVSNNRVGSVVVLVFIIMFGC